MEFPRPSRLRDGGVLSAVLVAAAGGLLAAARAFRKEGEPSEPMAPRIAGLESDLESDRHTPSARARRSSFVVDDASRSGEFAAARAALTQSDAERQRSEERFRLVAESSGSMIYDYDLANRTAFRSDALKSVFKWDDAQPTKSWWLERVHHDDRARVESVVNPVLDQGVGSGWTIEYRWQRGDGSFVTVLERGALMRDAQGVPTRCIGTVSDVSDRAELATQLRQAQKMEAVGQLAGGIAHDFNNLLTAIGCNVELLLDATDADDARRDDILQIREAAARAGTLTRQLLAFSRRQVLQPKPVDLNDTVGSMERMLRRVISGDVRLQTSLAPDLAPVFADVGQMEQVIMNLVLNARDAMPSGGEILVGTANAMLKAALQHRYGVLPPGPYVTLSVRDVGSGMSADVMERLFEPFFTTKGQGKGTGLGLATVHGIVVQSGGQVVVHSTLGQGTEFMVYLPAYRGTAQVRRFTPPSVPVVSAIARTVLVVDDDDAVREVAVRALARAGYRVLAASGGEAALSLIAAQDQGTVLLLTDVLMPGMNGPQLAHAVAERHPEVRIAFMSGFSSDELASSGLGSPLRTLLNKPFALPELVAFVENAFDVVELTDE